jgi:hypothetical protein
MAEAVVVEPPAGSIGAPVDANPAFSGPPVEKPAPEPKAGDPPAPEPKGGEPAPKDAPIEPKAGDTPPKPKTVADSANKDGPEPKQVVPADWPADWREKLAGADKALATRLARMNSPQDLLNSYRALEARLSSGELKKTLPTHYTDAELAEYKKANGIPDDANGYDTKIDGIVWGEHDKPMLDSFKQFALDTHAPPDQVKWALSWYAREQEAMVDRLAQQDQLHVQRGEDELRAKWGTEYKKNLNALGNLFAGAPPLEIQGPDGKSQQVAMFDAIMAARDPSGRALGNVPGFMDWAVGLSKALNPYATNVPDQGGDPAKDATVRYRELQQMSADKQGVYWRGPQAPVYQEEMRSLIDVLTRTGRMDDRGRVKNAA